MSGVLDEKVLLREQVFHEIMIERNAAVLELTKRLQDGNVLIQNASKQVTDSAKEILELKAKIEKLEKTPPARIRKLPSGPTPKPKRSKK